MPSSRAPTDATRSARLIVSADDRILAACESRKERGGDATQHSELSAVRVASSAFPKDVAGAVDALYQHRALRDVRRRDLLGRHRPRGLRISRGTAARLTGNHPENPTLSLPCRELFARGQRRVEVVGPLLEEEAAEAHAGFWDRA